MIKLEKPQNEKHALSQLLAALPYSRCGILRVSVENSRILERFYALAAVTLPKIDLESVNKLEAIYFYIGKEKKSMLNVQEALRRDRGGLTIQRCPVKALLRRIYRESAKTAEGEIVCFFVEAEEELEHYKTAFCRIDRPTPEIHVYLRKVDSIQLRLSSRQYLEQLTGQ